MNQPPVKDPLLLADMLREIATSYEMEMGVTWGMSAQRIREAADYIEKNERQKDAKPCPSISKTTTPSGR